MLCPAPLVSCKIPLSASIQQINHRFIVAIGGKASGVNRTPKSGTHWGMNSADNNSQKLRVWVPFAPSSVLVPSSKATSPVRSVRSLLQWNMYIHWDGFKGEGKHANEAMRAHGPERRAQPTGMAMSSLASAGIAATVELRRYNGKMVQPHQRIAKKNMIEHACYCTPPVQWLLKNRTPGCIDWAKFRWLSWIFKFGQTHRGWTKMA